LYNVCFHFTRFCVLDVLPVGLVRKLQHQFTIGVQNELGKKPAESRSLDLPAPRRTHLPREDQGLVGWSICLIWWLSLYNFWFQIYLVCFCVQGVFPAALPCTVYLVRRPQYLFTRSW